MKLTGKRNREKHFEDVVLRQNFHLRWKPLRQAEGASSNPFFLKISSGKRFTGLRKKSILILSYLDRFPQEKGGVRMDDYTRKFSLAAEKDEEIHQILTAVYRALEEKGYNPINQIVGYILSEDPTYITNHNNARTLIRKIDRDELLQVLVRKYLGQ